MSNERTGQQDYLDHLDPRRRQAVAELTGLVSRRYPTASFTIGPGEDDPRGTYITAIVDVDDPDEVTDLVIERELDLQVEEDLPVYVVPVRTPERVARLRQEQASPKRRDIPVFSHQPS